MRLIFPSSDAGGRPFVAVVGTMCASCVTVQEAPLLRVEPQTANMLFQAEQVLQNAREFFVLASSRLKSSALLQLNVVAPKYPSN
jgi:hypothetical protein